jgi:hypothetical protein
MDTSSKPLNTNVVVKKAILFLCQPGMGPAGGINLDVWRVK